MFVAPGLFVSVHSLEDPSSFLSIHILVDPSSFLSIHMSRLTNYSSKGSGTLFWHPQASAHVSYTQTHDL